MPQSHKFDTGEVTLAVHDWGGAGDPVLLAHPTGFHGLTWAPVARQLVERGRRVWSFDFRGHGDSDAPDIDYSWHHFGDDVYAVAHHLGIAGNERLLACGHSKGGAALLLAEAKLPGTFPRVWAYEPIVFPSDTVLPRDDEFPLAVGARKRRNEWSSTDEAYESYSSKAPLDVMTDEALRAYVEYGLRDRGDGVLELKCSPEVEGRIFSMGPTHGLWNELPKIETDVVVVCGGESRDIGPKLGAMIVERLPHARLEILDGAGHFGPQSHPDACVASMIGFTQA